jgi:hypothetical protein
VTAFKKTSERERQRHTERDRDRQRERERKPTTWAEVSFQSNLKHTIIASICVKTVVFVDAGMLSD